MSKIKIERAIYGSLDDVVGDGILSYSSGISRRAEVFKSLFDSIANKQLSKNYASLLLFLNTDQQTYTCAHIQGSHVEFPADGRSYCTRCIYEFEARHLETDGFFPIIQSLPKMEHRLETESKVSPDVDIRLKKQTFESLDENEIILFHIINHAILNGQQLFIHIHSSHDEYSENRVFESSKLKAILNVFDCMPGNLKKYLSLAFSTDVNVNQMTSQIVKPLVIVHHDDISNWQIEDAIAINWETDAIDCPFEYEDSSKYVQEICEIPLINHYLSKGDSNPIRNNVFRCIGNMRSHLDRAIDNVKPDSNDVTLMDMAYDSCESKNAYRHHDMASKLYHLITHGLPTDHKWRVTTKRLLEDYPELASSAIHHPNAKTESPVLTKEGNNNSSNKETFDIIPVNTEKTEDDEPGFNLFKFLTAYHIDYILVALCSALLTYFGLTISMEKGLFSNETNVVEEDLTVANDMTDTLFIDFDIPTGKIERATLAKMSNRVLKRIQSYKDSTSSVILCLHTEDKDIHLDMMNRGIELDSLYSLFGKSLTTGNYSLNDTISASINGQDSVFVVDKKHGFCEQMKGCSGTIKSMILATDTKTDTISVDDKQFEQTYHVKPDFNQVLYFFYIVNKIESWRARNDITDNLKY